MGAIPATPRAAWTMATWKPGIRSQESGVRSQGSGVRDQESGIRSQGSGPLAPGLWNNAVHAEAAGSEPTSPWQPWLTCMGYYFGFTSKIPEAREK
jgi:hypothetical protein